MQGPQYDDPSRHARQLPSGVILGRGRGEPEVIFEPCNNAPQMPQCPAHGRDGARGAGGKGAGGLVAVIPDE